MVYLDAHPYYFDSKLPNFCLDVKIGDFKWRWKSRSLVTPKIDLTTVLTFIHQNGINFFSYIELKILPFEYYLINRFYCQDFNSDGKTDILKVGDNKCALLFTEWGLFNLKQDTSLLTYRIDAKLLFICNSDVLDSLKILKYKCVWSN